MNKKDRYWRRVRSNIGVLDVKAQQRLRSSRVTIVGLGCIGEIIAQTCVRYGIGYVRGIDYDIFEPVNMNRQIFAYEDTIGKYKAEVVKAELGRIQSGVEFEGIADRLDEANGPEYLRGSNFVFQAVDDMISRVAIHRAARKANLPCATVSGAPKFRAFVSTFLPDGIPFEKAMGYPCGVNESLQDESIRKKIAEVRNQRARKAVERGAFPEWLTDFIQGNAGWSSTLERVCIEAMIAVREAVRYLTGEALLAPAPKAWLIDLDNPVHPVVIEEPHDGQTWDCTDW